MDRNNDLVRQKRLELSRAQCPLAPQASVSTISPLPRCFRLGLQR